MTEQGPSASPCCGGGDARFLTGQGRYLDDAAFPGAPQARFVSTPGSWPSTPHSYRTVLAAMARAPRHPVRWREERSKNLLSAAHDADAYWHASDRTAIWSARIAR